MDNKKKILVVDDEKYLLNLYKEILEEASYDVTIAGGGQEALDLAGQNKYNLVLLDQMMPNVDGIQVLSALKEDPDKYGSPVIVILTNLSSEVAIKTAFENKADGYLMKDELTPDQILKEVEGFLNK
jgi:CheY-like chemotaxis protein